MSRFATPTIIEHGIGAVGKIGEYLEMYVAGNVLLVCDKGVEKAGLTDKVIKLINDAGYEAVVWNEVQADPPVESVRVCTEFARESDINIIVALGGGSSIDTAKGVSMALVLEGDIGGYLDFAKPIEREGIPIIAIPTTSGTGSEVSIDAVISEPLKGKKSVLLHPFVAPRVALVDANMSVTMPPHITAATGIDALSHALETFTTSYSNHLTDAIAQRAIEMIIENLPKVYSDGEDLEARQKMADAAMMSAMAFNSSSVHTPHAMGHAIGAFWHIPHGIACAYGLVDTMLLVADVVPEKIRTVAGIFGIENSSTEEMSVIKEQLEKRMYELYDELNIPSLSKFENVDVKDFDKVVDNMMVEMNGLSGGALVMPEREFYSKVLNKVYHMEGLLKK